MFCGGADGNYRSMGKEAPVHTLTLSLVSSRKTASHTLVPSLFFYISNYSHCRTSASSPCRVLLFQRTHRLSGLPLLSLFLDLHPRIHLLIGERGGGGERVRERGSVKEREKNQCNKHLLIASHMLFWQGIQEQPRCVPWWGIEPATFWCMFEVPTNWATLPGLWSTPEDKEYD